MRQDADLIAAPCMTADDRDGDDGVVQSDVVIAFAFRRVKTVGARD
jgi:hypothetical protein